MIDKGLAYPDPYTAEELEAFRKKAEEEKRPFLYRDHRPETFEVWDGTKPLRFKTPVIKSYAWHDVVFGDLSAGPEALDDFIMIKADGYPTYNFAHIVDDLEMGITLVMRGQEYISSTPKYLSVYEALGIEPPVYACLPHILATGGQKKLGKRDGAKDILEYRNEGFLPDAMINFLVLIGWNPGTDQEIFTREELINIFEIDRIQHAGGTLSDDKLLWCNKEHLNKLSMDEFRNYLEPALEIARLKPGFNEEMFDRIIPTIRERISVRSEFVDMIENGELGYLFSNPGKSTRESAWKNSTPEIAKVHIESLLELLGNYEGSWDVESLKTVVMPYAEQSGKGDVLWPLRFILTGLEKSPDPFTVMYILGKDETIHRLNTSLEL
jgi:glutamyl-tRNA synthetase